MVNNVTMNTKNRRGQGPVPTNQLNSDSPSAMSSKTRDFLQKICYKQAASVDMTQYGFISDSKVNPVNLLLKPLRAQLEKICGSSNSNVGTSSGRVKKNYKGSMKQNKSKNPDRKKADGRRNSTL